MKQLIVLCGFILLSLIPTAAQIQNSSPYEISAGYNLRIFTQPNYARIGLSGGYVSGSYYILSRLSAAAEFTASYRSQGINGDLSIYGGMIGPRIYPFKHHKITPFAQVLFGDGYYRNSYPAFAGFPAQTTTYSGLTWEGGGGLDITHSSRWAIRLIEVDYGQTRFFASPATQNNLRASIGIIYRFGRK
jgi:hypothetical protein